MLVWACNVGPSLGGVVVRDIWRKLRCIKAQTDRLEAAKTITINQPQTQHQQSPVPQPQAYAAPFLDTKYATKVCVLWYFCDACGKACRAVCVTVWMSMKLAKTWPSIRYVIFRMCRALHQLPLPKFMMLCTLGRPHLPTLAAHAITCSLISNHLQVHVAGSYGWL